jgi:hypothetical protein
MSSMEILRQLSDETLALAWSRLGTNMSRALGGVDPLKNPGAVVNGELDCCSVQGKCLMA